MSFLALSPSTAYSMISISSMLNRMTIVTVSPKFQVVIPQSVRKALKVGVGMKCEVVAHNNTIVFIPLRPMKDMQGFLQGIDTTVPREDDRL